MLPKQEERKKQKFVAFRFWWFVKIVSKKCDCCGKVSPCKSFDRFAVNKKDYLQQESRIACLEENFQPEKVAA